MSNDQKNLIEKAKESRAMVELRLMVPDAIAQRLAKLGWTHNATWAIGSDWFTRLLLGWLARLGKPTQHRPPKPIQETGLWPLIGCIEALPDPIHSSNGSQKSEPKDFNESIDATVYSGR